MGTGRSVGKLEDEEGGLDIPGEGEARGRNHFAARIENQCALFDEESGVGIAAHAEVVVEGKQEGVEAAAVEEAAVVFLTGAPGGEAGGKVGPGGGAGKFPEDGGEEEAGGCRGTAEVGGAINFWKIACHGVGSFGELLPGGR